MVYLASLLRRRKQTAWYVTVAAYIFYFGLNLPHLITAISYDIVRPIMVIGDLALPISVLVLLAVTRNDFVVKSDQRGFRSALQVSAGVLIAAMIYGIAGFSLLDTSDFHQEIKLSSAVHYTIDQFDLTTTRPLQPSTKRAHVFVDSLSFISIASVIYVVIALFQPLKMRLIDQSVSRKMLLALMLKHGACSEDYFKLWPHDKQYFFDAGQQSGIAYHVSRGVALCLGDPVGSKTHKAAVVDEFNELCYRNDWTPAYVHITNVNRKLYESRGFVLQQLGQEAVIDLDSFESDVAKNKYFRHITNKFTKQGYAIELLSPPYNPPLVARLRAVSDDWLQRGGRVERSFAMGYFDESYIQNCQIMVVRDEHGIVQAFANLIPAAFDQSEATYDLLRHSQDGPGNISDFLLVNFITQLRLSGYTRLNMGLCPLTGLSDGQDESSKIIHNALRFGFANGDRFYSFSGLYRFKSKYQPEWRDRYVAYQGGIGGFTRSMTALMRTMRIKR